MYINKKIIHFEDDEFLAELYKPKFKEAGFNYNHYLNPPSNKNELVELIINEKPDLIIMDILMPEIDGFEATKILKADKRTKDIPIIGFDNLSQPRDIKQAKDVGMADYFVKATFSPNGFIEKIKKFLD